MRNSICWSKTGQEMRGSCAIRSSALAYCVVETGSKSKILAGPNPPSGYWTGPVRLLSASISIAASSASSESSCRPTQDASVLQHTASVSVASHYGNACVVWVSGPTADHAAMYVTATKVLTGNEIEGRSGVSPVSIISPRGCRGSLEAPLTGGCRRPNALRVMNRRYGSMARSAIRPRVFNRGAQRAPLASALDETRHECSTAHSLRKGRSDKPVARNNENAAL